MKTTRFAALALALTMALGTLTGCSGKDSSSAADTGNTLRIGAIAPSPAVHRITASLPPTA